jgi:hypothetical protein
MSNAAEVRGPEEAKEGEEEEEDEEGGRLFSAVVEEDEVVTGGGGEEAGGEGRVGALEAGEDDEWASFFPLESWLLFAEDTSTSCKRWGYKDCRYFNQNVCISSCSSSFNWAFEVKLER